MQSTSPQQTENGWPPLVRAIFEYDAEAVSRAVAVGENPNGTYAGRSLVELAAYHGAHEVLAALIQCSARVRPEEMCVLGEMEITDWKIDPIELEADYARVAQILLDHGARADVLAYNGRPLLETFPQASYPQIHRVLSGANSAAMSPNLCQ